MGCTNDEFGNSIQEQVKIKANAFRCSIKEAIKRQTSQVERFFEDGYIDDKNKKRLVCSVHSAAVSISMLIEMFENADIQNEFQFKKYVMAISDAICSFITGVTEEINLTVEKSTEADKSI